MPKKESDAGMVSETGNWNVADSYSRMKIMKPLIMCDLYEDIAIFGYESIIEELDNYQAPPNDVIRIKAVKRLIRELLRLIDNAKFAMKKSGTKKEILKYRHYLENLEKILPKVIEVDYEYQNENNSVSIVDEKSFNQILEKISEIKSKINEPLNKNHLIFTDKEEFDPKAFKERLKERMVNQG